jgi:mannose-6-phosphate isomerase-like protein (cupin superfamily)
MSDRKASQPLLIKESLKKFLTIQNVKELSPTMSDVYPLGFVTRERGAMTYLNFGEPLNFCALVEINPALGSRGNHVHKIKKEIFYILSGTVKGTYWLQNEHKEQAETFIHSEGDIITIQPELFHEFQALEPALALEFSPQSFMTSDTYYSEK